VRRASGAIALAALVLAGCGGNGDGSASDRCREDQRKSAELAVIASLYDRGELGPKARVRAKLDRLAARNHEDPFFDADGRLLSYYELRPSQRSLLAGWWANDPDVDRVAFDALRAARERVQPDC
jgi:hypothetical protein